MYFYINTINQLKPVTMYTSLNHLPDFNQEEQLNHLVRMITDTLDVGAIIYLGSVLSKTVVKSCFIPGGSEGNYQFEYDLLIIPCPVDTRADYELQDLIESRCRSFARVNATVRKMDAIKMLIKKGCNFFSTAFREGYLLYKGDGVEFPMLRALKDSPALKARQDWETFYKDASGYLSGAEFYADTGEFRHAVFLLHQAAERICAAMIRVFTGLHTSTHNLNKLFQYTRLFSLEPSAVFPRNSPEEIELYSLLFKGYSDARYRQSYQIGGNEIRVLLARMQRLHEVAERLCNGKLAALPGE